jgi:hypothetical protein
MGNDGGVEAGSASWCTRGALFCDGFDDRSVVNGPWDAVATDGLSLDRTWWTSYPASVHVKLTAGSPRDADLKKAFGPLLHLVVGFDVLLRSDDPSTSARQADVAYLMFGQQCALRVAVGTVPGVYVETNRDGSAGLPYDVDGALLDPNRWMNVAVSLDNQAHSFSFGLDREPKLTNVPMPLVCYQSSDAPSVTLEMGAHYMTQADINIDTIVVLGAP